MKIFTVSSLMCGQLLQLCTWMHPVAHLYMDEHFERPTVCHINDADIAQKLQLLLLMPNKHIVLAPWLEAKF